MKLTDLRRGAIPTGLILGYIGGDSFFVPDLFDMCYLVLVPDGFRFIHKVCLIKPSLRNLWK